MPRTAKGPPEPNKGLAQVRMTEWLVQGHVLTSKLATQRLGLGGKSRERVGRWLKELHDEFLDGRLASRHVSGRTTEYIYTGRHILSPLQIEEALEGVRLAESNLRVLGNGRLSHALHEAAAALRAWLPISALGESHLLRDLVLRPARTEHRADLASLCDQLLDAMVKQREVRFHYRKTANVEPREYRVRPWSLVDHAGGIYLFGEKCGEPSARRTFDVENISKMEVDNQTFTRPDDCRQLFEDYRGHHYGIFVRRDVQPEEIVLAVQGYARTFLARRPLVRGQHIEPAASPEAWSLLTASQLCIDQELIGRLLALAPEVRIVRPERLRVHYLRLLALAQAANNGS